MTTATRGLGWVAVGVAATWGLGSLHADARPKFRPASPCVAHRSPADWAADPGPRAIYICVGAGDLYRLEVGGLCAELRAPKVRLRTRVVSGGWDQRPLIIELVASDGHATQLPCKINGITALEPAAAQALMGKPKPAR